jgi:hypothetical protein
VRHWLQFFTALLLLAGLPAQAEEGGPTVQAFLGSLQLDDQTGDWDDVSDSGVDVDFSSLPVGGIEAEYAYGGEGLRWGINSGGSIAWKNDGTRISGGFSGETGGVVRIELDNSLLLLELHIGGFLRAFVSDSIALYAAAGPMVIYGEHEVEDEPEVEPHTDSGGEVTLTDSSSSDVGLGVYARAGFDVRIASGQYVGLGVRYMKAELDFSDTVGELDMEGPQYVITFTAEL